MKKRQYRVWFPNPGQAPVAVIVSAFGKEEALILAQAERIGRGESHAFITIEAIEDTSVQIETKRYSFLCNSEKILICSPRGKPRYNTDPAMFDLVDHIQKLEKIASLDKEASSKQRLELQLAGAQAEIERLASEIENQQYTITCASEENQQLKESLAEVRADLRFAKNIIEMHVERVAERDKLIEQMREALTWALTEARSTHGEQLIRAALRAADGGE